MKKIYTVIVTLIFLITISSCVFADGMAPAVNSYYAKINNKDGAIYYAYGYYYNWNEETKKYDEEYYKNITQIGILPYGTRIKVFWETNINGKTYLSYTVNPDEMHNTYNSNSYYIDEKNITIVSDEIEIDKTKKYELKALNSQKVKIYEGPSTFYDVVGSIDSGARVDCYPEKGDYEEQWLYVLYNGVSGWVDLKGGDIAVNYNYKDSSNWTDRYLACEPVKIYKAVPFVDENVIYTIPKNTFFNVKTNEYSTMTYYEGAYKTLYRDLPDFGITGIINSEDFPVAYADNGVKFKILDKNGLNVYENITIKKDKYGYDRAVKPSTDAIINGKIDYDKEVTCYMVRSYDTGEYSDYYYYYDNGLYGYIYKYDNIIVINEEAKAKTKKIAMSNFKLYDALPAVSSNEVTQINSNDIVTVHELGIKNNQVYNGEYDYYDTETYPYVSINGMNGLINTNEHILADECQEQLTIVVDGTRLYKYPNFSSEVLNENIPVGTIVNCYFAQNIKGDYDYDTSKFIYDAREGWFYVEHDGVNGWIYTYPNRFFAKNYLKAIGTTYSWYLVSDLRTEILQFIGNNQDCKEGIDTVYTRLLNVYNGLSIQEKKEIEESVELELLNEQENIDVQETEIANDNDIQVAENNGFQNIPPQEMIMICISGAIVLTITAIVIIALINKKEEHIDEIK